MKNSVLAFIGISSSLILAGCTSGTTYGTGKTHEAQTAEGLYNMFALKTEKTKIDYNARPDLIMPANKTSLPQPSTIEASTSAANPDWPETPEQRIARIREAAPKADERSGELPLEFMTRKKEGIEISRAKNNGYSEYDPRNTSLSTNPKLRDDVSEEVKRRREELAYSKGNTRKYLTEPPSEYRTPSENAVAGDLGVTPEEVKKREAEARKRLLEEQSPG